MEGLNQLDPDAKAVLRQMQTGLKKIDERDEEINSLTAKMTELKPAVIDYNNYKNKLKDLQRLNKDDKEFMHRSMKWYEERTGVEVHKDGTFFAIEDEENADGN